MVAFVFLQILLGETLKLPDWVDAISPFWHLPGLPVETFEPVPALSEHVLAAALVLLGVRGFRRRDLAAISPPARRCRECAERYGTFVPGQGPFGTALRASRSRRLASGNIRSSGSRTRPRS